VQPCYEELFLTHKQAVEMKLIERYEQRLLIFLTLKRPENDKKASNTLDKIVLINSMIEAVERSESLPFTYNGGTYPYLVLKKIKVKKSVRNNRE
jgi:hypothetical protein